MISAARKWLIWNLSGRKAIIWADQIIVRGEVEIKGDQGLIAGCRIEGPNGTIRNNDIRHGGRLK